MSAAIVPACGNAGQPACTLENLFQMVANIITFIIWDITTPLAVLFLIIGGILMLVSSGNEEMLGLGKKILSSTVIGMALVYGAWLIVSVILTAVGYNKGNWWEITF